MLFVKFSIKDITLFIIAFFVSLIIYQIPFIESGDFRNEYRNYNQISNRTAQIKCLQYCDQNLDYVNFDIDKFLAEQNKKIEDFPDDYFKYIDGWTNIQWRIEIYKASIEELNPLFSNLIKNSLGENLIQNFVNDEKLPIYMFYASLSGGESSTGLRNAHNTFLTGALRFGILFFLITIFYLIKTSLTVFKNDKNILFVFLPFIQTFFDPLLDGPVLAVPFYFIFFQLLFESKLRKTT